MLDTLREVVYVLQEEPGAALFVSSYDGFSQKRVTPFVYHAPRALALDPTDGSVLIAEPDTFEPGCDPLEGNGAGAVNCKARRRRPRPPPQHLSGSRSQPALEPTRAWR